MPSGKKIQTIRSRLLEWYHEEKRNLPWRKTSDPFHILVSEVMLQQTQVKTVIPYYRRWVKSFPTAKKLAAAPEARVLKLWEGLGYYSRARNLQKAAKLILEKFEGKVPKKLDEILELPGIGRYTAGAVLSIAFNQNLPVLDGNVKRVLSRLFCLSGNGATTLSENRLWKTAETLLPEGQAGNFNQAVMELGALVCLPKNPLCSTCPLNSVCLAKSRDLQDKFPLPKVRTPTKKIQVSAAVIQRNGKIFIQQRPMRGLMAGLWEFPGGKLEKEESPEECLKREIKEELGVEIKINDKLMTVKHSYTQFRVTLHVYLCRLSSGRIRATQCENWKWVIPEELHSFPFPAANARILKHMVETPRNGHKRLRTRNEAEGSRKKDKSTGAKPKSN